MKIISSSLDRLCRQTTLTLLLLSLLLLKPLAAAAVDLNGNGMSDIWELIFNAASLLPNTDSDNDGASNLQESIAGTDPLDPNSAPRITLTAITATNFSVTMPCALGKQYELQSVQPDASGAVTWSNWVSETSLVVRSGSTVTLSAPAGTGAKFFRIAISDVDTDGDGLTDWEEYQLGLDPMNAYSNGQLDSNGAALTDYAFVIGKLAQQNVVTISATDPTANQPDPGQPSVNQGQFTISRGGFPLNAITVNFAPAPAGPGSAIERVDYNQLPRSIYLPVGVSSAVLTVVPLANSNRLSAGVATVQLLPGTAYRLSASSNASVVIYPSGTPSGFGLTAQYFTNSSSTYSSAVNFNPANLMLTRVDPVVDFTWSSSSPFPNGGYFTARWTGQIQPQYSETYFFDVNSDDGFKLWVNDQLISDRWATGATDFTSPIFLQAGQRYNIRIEYFNGGGAGVTHLSWYSPSQPKQVVPSARLYPASVAPAPTGITSALAAVGFLGQPFSFNVTAANSPIAYTAAGLPPGLVFDAASGLISGVPNLAGDFQVLLTATNAVGVGASVLDLQVLDTGSSVTCEVWTGVPGVNISDIPLGTPANVTNFLGSLEGVTDYGDNYGERVRGFFTAPVTGNYYFFIAGSDSAEFWLSNDSEPANKVRRAYVLPQPNPASQPAFGTAPRQWNLQPNQISGWLTLVAGERYYLEVLHKAGVGTNDNWSVGWVQDPTGTNTTASGLIPNYLLSRYFAPAPAAAPGALYSANLLVDSGVTGSAVGTASLRLNADGTQAILRFSLNGLSSAIIGEHIVSDPYLINPSQILFDISAARPQPDGSYLWPITAVGTLSAADVREVLNENKAYLTILTANYPDGELDGHFTLAEGTQTFTPPPPPPAWTDDHADPSAAARFLIQATFGPTPTDVASVQALGYDSWLNNQFSLPASHQLPYVLANQNTDPTTLYPSLLTFNSWWQQSVTAPDQLRQRVAFALSEIMVVSEQGVLMNNARALSSYYDTLVDNAFGNFRTLLEAVTLSPAMGLYLNMQGNDKGSIITGIHANENYAREIMQLFSIGLNRVWPDGTLVMDSQGNLVPTYDQNVIMGMAAVFTGWNYWQPNQANGRLPTIFNPPADYIDPMVLVPMHHDLGTKLLLDHVMLPQAWGTQAQSSSTNFDTYCAHDLEAALDVLCNNQNVGPFICRELIQRLVTSNPSRDYLYRVVQVFNDNGAGVRGDLQAVVRAILLDYEARSPVFMTEPTFGKQREPLLRATALPRAFPAPMAIGGTYTQYVTRTVTVTTTNAHRLNTGDILWITFSDTSGQAPPTTQGYSVTVTSPTNFTLNAPGLSTLTYTQAQNVTFTNQTGTTNFVTIVTNAITVNLSGHGLIVGTPVYLNFTSGGASNGQYQVIWTNSTMFAVSIADTNTLGGSGLLWRPSTGGYTQSRTNITVYCNGPHALNLGDSVYIVFSKGSASNGVYQVSAVPDATHFTVVSGRSTGQAQQSGVTPYPLRPPPTTRSGNVSAATSTFHLGYTDSALEQSPLRSPTVFNFFFPGYKFPGPLASAGLTTPEFQLTSDTTAAVEMNYMQGGLFVQGGLNNNTYGISSFVGGNGAMAIDLGPWMTPGYTSNAGLPSLVDALSSLMVGRPLAVTPSGSVKDTIVSYVGTLPYTTPTPTATQMRDRVRSVVHLIATSPDFTIQY